jgi:hypothetical protein
MRHDEKREAYLVKCFEFKVSCFRSRFPYNLKLETRNLKLAT